MWKMSQCRRGATLGKIPANRLKLLYIPRKDLFPADNGCCWVNGACVPTAATGTASFCFLSLWGCIPSHPLEDVKPDLLRGGREGKGPRVQAKSKFSRLPLATISSSYGEPPPGNTSACEGAHRITQVWYPSRSERLFFFPLSDFRAKDF
jgi:hypothetical protein